MFGSSPFGPVPGVSAAVLDAHFLTDQAEAELNAEVVVSADGASLVTAADYAAMRTALSLANMALQAKDAVDIDGGVIDGTAVGGTTPAAGDFTTIKGGVPPITVSGDTVLTAAQCKGQVVYITATGTITLPAVADCVEGASVTIYSTTAAVVSVDPDDDDRIVLDGTALADGTTIDSPGAAGDFVTLHKDSAAGWTVVGRSGAWS